MFSIHLTTSSATTRSHWNFFSAFKELFRFILTTIILTHSSGVTAASIINNYKSSAATSVKRSRKMDPFGVVGRSGRACQRAEHVNLWNFRTFSSLSVSQHAVPVSASTVTEPQQEKQQQHGLRRSRRNNANSDPKAMVQSVARSNVSSTEAEATRPPTVQEMKAKLGPLGLIVATAVEVGITTAGSYLSGGVFGYVWGGVSGSPSLFKPLENAGGAGAQPQRKFAQLQSKLASLNGAACTQAKSWGELSAAFSGCHALTRCVRGGKEDRWNSIVGSGLAGAYLNKGAGVQGMLQGGMTYASFTYVIDFVFGSSSGGGRKGGSDNRQFEFQDTPLVEEQDRGY